MDEVIQLLRLYFNFFGTVRCIHADNFFDSKEMHIFAKDAGCDLSFACAYRPESNGLCEKVHKDFRRTIPLIMKECGIAITHWSEACYIAANYVNSTPNRATGFCPQELMRGTLVTNVFQQDRTLPQMQQLWNKALENIIRYRKTYISNQPKTMKKLKPLVPGTPVVAHLGNNAKQKIHGIVIIDNGYTILMKKNKSLKRFQAITVHKSRISVLPCAQVTSSIATHHALIALKL